MKKPVKIALAAAGIVLVVLVAVFAVYGILAQREISKMTPTPTGMVLRGVYAVKDSYVNFWIVETSESYIAFDAGNAVLAVVRELVTLEIDPARVTAVFLTHTDADHVGALSLFPNATVYIGSGEEQMINGTTSRSPGVKNRIRVPYRTVDDGQVVSVDGIPVRAVFTPGHTPGHTCWFFDDRYLFTGDTLGLSGGRVGPFSTFFNMDTERETESLKELAGTVRPTHLFTGHFGWTAVTEETFSAYR